MHTPAQRLDLAALATLTFETPDPVRFPALRLARAAMTSGTAASAALNAADEVMVKAFLDRKLGFLGIAETIERVLERMTASGDLNEARSIVDVMAVDAAARQVSLEELSRIAH